jgi:hypothetical protein
MGRCRRRRDADIEAVARGLGSVRPGGPFAHEVAGPFRHADLVAEAERQRRRRARAAVAGLALVTLANSGLLAVLAWLALSR